MPTTATTRRSVALARASTSAQDKDKQIGNMRRMLADQGQHVAEADWVVITANRAEVTATPAFKALITAVERDQIDAVYVESLDRFGTTEDADLLPYIKTFRTHRTRLFDLTERRDWTDRKFETKLLLLLGVEKSRGELIKISNRTQRAKITVLNSKKTWLGGPAPFGYAKVNYGPDGTVLWRFEYTAFHRGNVYYPAADGGWRLVQEGVKVPKKGRTDVLKLTPSMFKERVELIKLLFTRYATEAISPRQVTVWANKAGYKMYGQPIHDSRVKQILCNRKYVGDYEYGVRDLSRYQRFNKDGIMEDVPDAPDRAGWKRKPEERLLVADAWPALIDRDTFDRVQVKLDAPERKVTYPPRRGEWFLKRILFCGHCGLPMESSSGSQLGGADRNQVGGYLCKSYKRGYRSGFDVKCGHYGISHAWAEEIILQKLKEDGVKLAEATGNHVFEHADILGTELEQLDEEAMACVREGASGYFDHLAKHPELVSVVQVRKGPRRKGSGRETAIALRPDVDAKQIGAFLERVEREKVVAVKERLATLRDRHAAMTRSWAGATPQMQSILLADVRNLEEQITKLEPLTVPLDDRLSAIREKIAARQAELEKLTAEYETMELRQRGEAIARVLEKVVFYWDKLPYKRSQYRLLTDKTEFHYREASQRVGTCASVRR